MLKIKSWVEEGRRLDICDDSPDKYKLWKGEGLIFAPKVLTNINSGRGQAGGEAKSND